MFETKRWFIGSALVALLAAVPAPGRVPAEDPFPESRAGEMAEAFIAAWNARDLKALEAFELRFRADAKLAEKSVAERVASYEGLLDRIGTIAAERCTPVGEHDLRVGGQVDDEWLSVEFQLEPEPPHELLTILFRRGDPPPVRAAGTAGRDGPTAEQVVRGLADYLDRLEGIGFTGAVVVERGGEVLLEEGYGLADRESGRPATAETVFTTGSITKQFTGAAIMTLVMAGELSVDDPITRFFEDVPEDKQSITVHQLLTHSSGLGDGFAYDFDPQVTREWMLEQVLGSELLWPPGRRYRYSNAGYSLLGMILENVSGQGYEAYLREHLFLPAGMKHTGYLLPEYADDELAVGYLAGERWGTLLEKPMLPDGPNWALRGNGGIHTTVGDMLRWHHVLEGEAILSAEAKDAYFSPHVDEGGGDSFYGYGWVNRETPRGTRLLSHDGGNPIFMADCHRYVDEDAFIYVCTSAEVRAGDVMQALDAILFGYEYALPPKVAEVAPEVLARHAGTYVFPSGAEVEVTATADRLEFRGEGFVAADLLAGGSGEVDPEAGGLVERTLAMTAEWVRGDFESFREACSERLRERHVDQALAEELGRFEQEGGAFRECTWARTTREEGATVVAVRMTHEHRPWFAFYHWKGGELVGFGADEILPGGGEAGSSIAFYPESGSRFRSFSVGSPVSVLVELEDGELRFQTSAGVVRAKRR